MSKEMLHLLCMVWAKEAVITESDSGYIMNIRQLDRKVLSTTARPKRVQEFINAEKFFSIWAENDVLFEKEPPEIAIVYTKMPMGADGIAHAIPVDLSHPIRTKEGFAFQSKFREQRIPIGSYADVALFIDWLPTPYCPESIKVIFSGLY